MEVRILTPEELGNAAGLSRYVFDNCLKNRMEFPQTISFVEEYITEENLRTLYSESKLVVWGVFEQQQLVGVSALQSDGMITMLYVLPQCWRRGYGSELLNAMRLYAKDKYGFERVSLNANPAWTSYYFAKKGFHYTNPQQNMRVPFVGMYALSSNITQYAKKKVSWKVILLAILGCLAFATIVGCAFMTWYLFQ